MAYILLPHRTWRRQPQYPVQVDFGNPLANGLVEYTLPRPWGFVTAYGTRSTQLGATITELNYSSSGLSRRHRAVSSASAEAAPIYNLTASTPNGLTLFALGIVYVSGAIATNFASARLLYGIDFNGIGTVGIGIAAMGGTAAGVGVAASLTSNRVSSAVSVTAGAEIPIFVTHPGGSAAYTIEVPGFGSQSTTTTTPDAVPSTPRVFFGYNASTSSPGDKAFLVGGFWKRLLTEAEKLELRVNPWQLFKPQVKRLYFFPASGAATTVSASAVTHSYSAATPKVNARTAPAQVVHAYTAQTPQVRARVAPGAVTHTYSGFAPQLKSTVAVGAVAHTYVAGVPSILAGASILAPAATHTYGAATPQVKVSVQPGAVTHTYVGNEPSITAGNAVGVTTVTHSYSASAPKLSHTIKPSQVAHTYAGAEPKVSTSVSSPAAVHTYTAASPTVLANLLIAVPTVTHTYVGNEPTFPGAATVQKGGGRAKPSRRKRKPLLVEIDGESFVVSSEAEAEALIEQAAELAKVEAAKQAEQIVEKRKAKARKDGLLNTKPLRLDEPHISVQPAQDGYIDRAWVETVRARFDEEVRAAYEAAAQQAELQLLLARQAELDEEDEVVALLLTIL